MSHVLLGAIRTRPAKKALLGPFPTQSIIGLVHRIPPGACRFLVAGGLSSLVNWLVRFPLSMGLPYAAAVGLAYAVGMAVSFKLYRSWVFPGSPLPLRSQVVRFVLVNVAGLATVVAAAQLLVAVIGRAELFDTASTEAVGHGLAIVLGAVVNFAGHRAITFARAAWMPRVAAGRLAR